MANLAFRCCSMLFVLASLAGCASSVNTGSPTNVGDGQFVLYEYKAQQPAPTVLISHGSACMQQHHVEWAKQINAWGFNAVVIDHCTRRGVGIYTGQMPPANLQAEDKAQDYAKTAAWVRSQTWHKGKVAVIGFSRGGAGVLNFADKHFHLNRGTLSQEELSRVDFAVAYYPGCIPVAPPMTPSIPILIHHGRADSLAATFHCRYESLKDSKYKIVLYDNVHHSFDDAGPDIVGRSPGSAGGTTWVARRFNSEANSRSRQLTRAYLEENFK